MRSRLNILVAAVVAALVVPQLAMAESVEDQLRLMNERMTQMEDQLQATQDELEASQDQVERQESVIEKAGLERETQSGLAAFYDQVNISGWLAASWWWNFNDPQEITFRDQNFSQSNDTPHGVNTGRNYSHIPFHPDHNSFSVDQLWFEIEKPVTEESRAGFRADLVFGKTAGVLGGVDWNRVSQPSSLGEQCHDGDGDFDQDECRGDSASDFNLFQAYVQYLTPFGPTLKAGKFATLVGSETVGTVYNYNITRGIVWSLLQPVNHYGVMFDGETEGGITYAIGALNSVDGYDPDINNDKSIMGSIGYNAETWGIRNTIIWGKEAYGEGRESNGVYDLVINWNPNENFSGWINFDYKWVAHDFTTAPNNGDAWGIAVAGRYALNDRLGLALRGEYVADGPDDNALLGISDAGNNGNAGPNHRVWALTGTVDYELTDNLVMKVEARYDRVSCYDAASACDVFISDEGATTGIEGNDAAYDRNDQWLGGVELTYSF